MAENNRQRSEYPFAVGRIRAIEDSVFSKDQYARMLSLDRDGQLKMLAESGYGSGASNSDLESMIDAEMSKVKALMDEIAPYPELTNLLFHEYDAHNLKTLLKARIVGINPDDMLLSCGVFDTEIMKVCVSADEYSMLGEDFKVLEKLEGNTNPGEISVAVDNAFYAHIFTVLKKRREPLLKEYFRIKAGYTNALTRLRGKKLGFSAELINKLLISGDYPEPQTAADDVRAFERECAVKLYDCLRENRADPFGVAALVCYISEKQNEARNIRIIFAGGGENDIDY